MPNPNLAPNLSDTSQPLIFDSDPTTSVSYQDPSTDASYGAFAAPQTIRLIRLLKGSGSGDLSGVVIHLRGGTLGEDGDVGVYYSQEIEIITDVSNQIWPVGTYLDILTDVNYQGYSVFCSANTSGGQLQIAEMELYEFNEDSATVDPETDGTCPQGFHLSADGTKCIRNHVGTVQNPCVQSSAEYQDEIALDGLDGDTVWFNNHQFLDAGTYRVTLTGGAMKHAADYGYSVQNPRFGSKGFKLADGVQTFNAPGAFDEFSTAAACNSANAGLTVEFTHIGGRPLGVFLNGEPFTDNIAGLNLAYRLCGPIDPKIGTGTGLNANYFNSTDASWHNRVLSRVDAQVNLDIAGNASPDAAVSPNFSTRWTGEVEAYYNGDTTLRLELYGQDNNARLYIDGVLIASSYAADNKTLSGVVEMERGQRKTVVLEHVNSYGAARCKLFWSSARFAEELIPQTQLYPLDILGTCGTGYEWRDGQCALPIPPTGAPAADFSFTVYEDGRTVRFHSEAVAASGQTLTGQAWVFGDGATGTGADVTHLYAAGGTFNISLTVTQSDGQTATTAKSLTLPAAPPINQPPTAEFDAAPSGLAVEFDASPSSDPEGSPLVFFWNFGDGQTAQLNNVDAQHQYAQAGTYNVTLTVQDSAGQQATVTHPVTVAVSEPPIAPCTPAELPSPVKQNINASAGTFDVTTPNAAVATCTDTIDYLLQPASEFDAANPFQNVTPYAAGLGFEQTVNVTLPDANVEYIHAWRSAKGALLDETGAPIQDENNDYIEDES